MESRTCVFLLFTIVSFGSVIVTGEPTETQAAQCTITSGDVKASAQATVTTRLDGVCETASMMTAFQLLESRLLVEIYHIRLILSQIQNPTYTPLQHSQFMFPHVNLNPTLYHSIKPPPPKPKPQEIPETTPVPERSLPELTGVDQSKNVSTTLDANSVIGNASTTVSPPISTISTPTTPSTPTTTTLFSSVKIPEKATPRPPLFPFLKSLPLPRKVITGPRDFEIFKFNNTILSGKEAQVFTYFWKIDNYTQKLSALEQQNSTELHSPGFVISGFNMRIKASLNHLNRDYLYLKLEEVPREQSAETNSVILETGDLFHEIEDTARLRYKITVLDQSAAKNDLISQEFTDTTSGFMIPSSALTSTDDRYTKNNLILIKVILYL